MMQAKKNDSDSYLKIYETKSEFFSSAGVSHEFKEGKISADSKKRLKLIKDSFESGFLENTIVELRTSGSSVSFEDLEQALVENISVLVESVTSEVGRGLVALTIMQLSIKSISPDQDIRLHKGSNNKNSFSWVDGISMRTLDKNYVTPILRKYNLLKLNADGFMMTRSLAENYPYTKLYKAQLRGAKDQWLNITELLENGITQPIIALQYMLSLLINKASDFEEKCNTLINIKDKFIDRTHNEKSIRKLIFSHINNSDYAARLMEVSMHSLMQAVIETGILGDQELKPLSQMRSANKKHGNIGDIELLENNEIVESWDAKYGKSYLRDEIDEVSEKLHLHEKVETVGFVTTEPPIRNDEITKKKIDVYEQYGIDIKIVSLDDWTSYLFNKIENSEFANRQILANNWLSAYTESLAQKRRDIAPIDEPCYDWVNSLISCINTANR